MSKAKAVAKAVKCAPVLFIPLDADLSQRWFADDYQRDQEVRGMIAQASGGYKRSIEPAL